MLFGVTRSSDCADWYKILLEPQRVGGQAEKGSIRSVKRCHGSVNHLFRLGRHLMKAVITECSVNDHLLN